MKEIYNIVNDKYLSVCKKPIINLLVKVELLDHYENTLGVVTSKLSSTSGDINIKYEQGTTRTCSITINNYDNSVIPTNENNDFYINRKFKIYTGMYDKDEDIIYWFSQGVFVVTSFNYSNLSLSLSGTDKFAFFTDELKHHVLQNTYKIPVDTKVGKLISDILTLDMGNGVPTDPIPPIIDSELYDTVLPYDIEKTANETMGDILKEIATALNADIYYDRDGHLVLSKSIVDEYHKQSPIYEFENEDTEFVNISLSCDYTKAINQVTVTGTNTDDEEVHSYTAKNDNPSSPLRISLVGNMTDNIEETSMGYSDKRCQDYAEYLLKKRSIITTSASYNCTPLPHLDVNKTIRLTKYAMSYDQSDFLISEITIPLQPNEYTLSISNIEVLPFNDSVSSLPDSAIGQWVVREEDNINSLQAYVNNSGSTFVVAPRNVGTKMTPKLGALSGIPITGLQGVTNLYVEEGITSINDNALTNTYYNQCDYNGNLYSNNDGTGNDITNIELPETLTTIGRSAFCFSYLENINLPSSLKSIGNAAFEYSSLESITIPDGCTVEAYAFAHCINLKAVNISNNCTIEEYAIYDCPNLESLKIGEFCNLGELNLYGMFSLKELIIPNSAVVSSVSGLSCCNNLKNVVLSPSVTSVSLEYCHMLETITIKNPECSINLGFTGVYESEILEIFQSGVTVYGYTGSTAETYAANNNMKFVSID